MQQGPAWWTVQPWIIFLGRDCQGEERKKSWRSRSDKGKLGVGRKETEKGERLGAFRGGKEGMEEGKTRCPPCPCDFPVCLSCTSYFLPILSVSHSIYYLTIVLVAFSSFAPIWFFSHQAVYGIFPFRRILWSSQTKLPIVLCLIVRGWLLLLLLAELQYERLFLHNARCLLVQMWIGRKHNSEYKKKKSHLETILCLIVDLFF